jgi:hypothetical protein
MAKVNFCHPEYPYGYEVEDEPKLEMAVSEFHVAAFFDCEPSKSWWVRWMAHIWE